MEQLDELLADVCARADEVRHAADPERKMRELLGPLRAFVKQQIEATASNDHHQHAKHKAPAYLTDAVTRIQALVPTGPRTAPAHSDTSNTSSTDGNITKSPVHSPHKTAKSPTGIFSGAVSRFQAFVRGSPASTSRDSTMAIVLSPKRSFKDKSSMRGEAATRIQALVRGKSERVSFIKQQSFLLQGTKVRFVSSSRMRKSDGPTDMAIVSHRS